MRRKRLEDLSRRETIPGEEGFSLGSGLPWVLAGRSCGSDLGVRLDVDVPTTRRKDDVSS